MKNFNQSFINMIQEIVKTELHNTGLMSGQWHLGIVDSVIDSKNLMVKINGSDVAQKVPCNPDVSFVANDQIWVIFINGNSKDKFALCKRGV